MWKSPSAPFQDNGMGIIPIQEDGKRQESSYTELRQQWVRLKRIFRSSMAGTRAGRIPPKEMHSY